LCLRLQVRLTQLGPYDRASPYLRCVLKEKQDDVSDKDKTMDNVQKRNICVNFFFCTADQIENTKIYHDIYYILLKHVK
jgi:hypothetical protein